LRVDDRGSAGLQIEDFDGGAAGAQVDLVFGQVQVIFAVAGVKDHPGRRLGDLFQDQFTGKTDPSCYPVNGCTGIGQHVQPFQPDRIRR
jgi:hypothetical protein